MTRQAISELLERVRAASGPVAALDLQIAIVAQGVTPEWQEYSKSWAYHKDGSWVALQSDGPYTASLDAIVALIERELLGAMRASGSMEDGPFCRLLWPGAEHSYVGNYVDENATTEVLACCAAFLSAKLETIEETT